MKRKFHEPLTFQQQFINCIKANDTGIMIALLNTTDESIKNEINRCINEIDKDLRVTPVILATKKNNKKMVIALLKAGADPYIEHVEGALPRKLKNDKDSHEEIADLLLLNQHELPSGQNWFFHERMCYLDAFPQPKKDEAACFGIGHLGMQAALSEDLPMFNLRNHIIHDLLFRGEFAEQIKIIEAERIDVVRLTTKKILEAEAPIDESKLTKERQQEHYNNIREQALKLLSLRDRAMHAIELLNYAYLMMIYQKTRKNYRYLFENKVSFQDAKAVLPLVKPLALDSQKTEMLINFSLGYQKNALRNDVEKLTEILNEGPRIPCPISMVLSNTGHTFEVGFDTAGWHCIDANNLNRLYFKNGEIANQIFSSLLGHRSPDGTVNFEARLYADEKNKDLIINKINHWLKTIGINQHDALTKAVLNGRDHGGATWLYLAASHHYLADVKKLLEAGADPNLATNKGYTPLYTAAYLGNIEIVKLLLENNAGPNLASNVGNTPLHTAASKRHSEITKLLLMKGANPDRANNEGETPLYFAARTGNIEIVKLLLENNADPDLANNAGHTPLHTAVAQGHLEIIELLLAMGANLDEKLINIAILEGRFNVIHALLEKGASLDYTINNGMTTVHIAAQEGHLNIIEWILNKTKIDPNVASKNGITPLFIAAMNGHLQVVKFFCEKCVIDLTKKIETDVQSLLQLAEFFNVKETIINYFKNNNVNPADTTYKISMSPLDIARICKHNNIIQYSLNPNEILEMETEIIPSTKLKEEEIFRIAISKLSSLNNMGDFNDWKEFISQFEINDKIKNNYNVQMAIAEFIIKYYEKNNAKLYVLESLVYELHGSSMVKITDSKVEEIFKKAASECIENFSNIIKRYDEKNLIKIKEDKSLIKNTLSYYMKAADLASIPEESQNEVLSSFCNELANKEWRLQLNQYNLNFYNRIINISPFDSLHFKPIDKLAEYCAQLKDINVKLTTMKRPKEKNNIAFYSTFFAAKKRIDEDFVATPSSANEETFCDVKFNII